MDIYQRLKDDHGKQRGLAAGLMETSGDSDERRRLFAAFKDEVEAHAAAEEQTFYAALIACTDGQDQARHSIAEHKDAADLIEEIEGTDMSHGGWLLKFEKLKEELEHHLKEEEDDVFPLARKLISEREARELGERFDELKAEKLSSETAGS